MDPADFIKTLKRIGYNEADLLDESDFISDLSRDELRSFFQVFSALDENNVLTTEEIEEYSALTNDELAEIEEFRKSGQFEKDDEQEKRKDICFLQEQLTNLEDESKILYGQLKLFKKHEENLLQEKAMQENYLVKAKKRLNTIEISKVPKAEDEIISSSKSCLENAGDIKSLISLGDSGENKLPSSDFFKDLIHQYLETEKKILHCISADMETNFQLEENGHLSFIKNEILQNERLKNEMVFLQKKLKNNIIENVTSTMEIKKNESKVKYFEAAASSSSHMSGPRYQLRQKIDDLMKHNEQLKSKEEKYISYLSDITSKYVDALVAKVSLSIAAETFNNFHSCAEKISLPKNYLVRQRLRVEMLIASLCEQKTKFVNLQELIQDLCNKISEKLDVQERQVQINRNLSEASNEKSDEDFEAAVFSSMYKILANFNDFTVPEKSVISVTDVVEEANKVIAAEDSLNDEQEENIQIINKLENYSRSLESVLNAEGKYSNWLQLEQLWNVSLNNLDIKLINLERNISECTKDMEQKQKLLEKRRNLQLSRNLFVYALMNRELFKRHIDDIKIAVENANGYKSKS